MKSLGGFWRGEAAERGLTHSRQETTQRAFPSLQVAELLPGFALRTDQC